MDDEQADDEQSDADEDLHPALLRLEANLARSGEEEDQRERVEPVHEAVALGLQERDHERNRADRREHRSGRREDRNRYRRTDPDRRADRLSPNSVSLAHQDVEDE